MRVLQANDRFRQLLKTTDGLHFHGEVESSGDVFDDASLAEHSLRVGLDSVCVPGKAIHYAGDRFLIAAGVTEAFDSPDIRFLRVIRVTHELAWSRMGTVTDPVSGLSKGTAAIPLGNILIALKHSGAIEDAFRVQGSKFRMITNSPVQVGDSVGSYTITFVTPHLGIYFAEVK